MSSSHTTSSCGQWFLLLQLVAECVLLGAGGPTKRLLDRLTASIESRDPRRSRWYNRWIRRRGLLWRPDASWGRLLKDSGCRDPENMISGQRETFSCKSCQVMFPIALRKCYDDSLLVSGHNVLSPEREVSSKLINRDREYRLSTTRAPPSTLQSLKRLLMESRKGRCCLPLTLSFFPLWPSTTHWPDEKLLVVTTPPLPKCLLPDFSVSAATRMSLWSSFTVWKGRVLQVVLSLS